MGSGPSNKEAHGSSPSLPPATRREASVTWRLLSPATKSEPTRCPQDHDRRRLWLKIPRCLVTAAPQGAPRGHLAEAHARGLQARSLNR